MYVKACNGLTSLEPNQELQLKYLDFIGKYATMTPRELDAACARMSGPRIFKEHAMSLHDALVEMGVAKGVEKGKAESIVDLFHHGVLDAQKARQCLLDLAARQEVSQELVEAALKRLDAPSPKP